jgi:hypothetical protein
MDARAFEQAETSFKRAQVAAERLTQVETFADTQDAWTDFLLAISRIYSKFEQGVKGNSKAQDWFNLLKNERKKDPLLKYLHFARNADEHGLVNTINNSGKKIFPLNIDGSKSNSIYFFGSGVEVTSAKISDENGVMQDMVLADPEAYAVLGRAEDDRYSDYCDPPNEHLGKWCEMTEPKDAANAALDYFEKLIAAARYLLDVNP